jgi:glycosyltransferase involved in cell wall biosynthesis
MVTTAHVGGLQALPPALRVATAAYERAIGRMILARSTRAIAVSDSVAQHLRTLGVDDGRIDVIPNGVDHELFRPRRPVSGVTPSTVPRVLFVGRLISNKGPQVLLRALILLRSQGVNFQAEIVGEGPLRCTLERTIRRHGLSGRVTLTGATSDIAQRLQLADVVVRPSFTEGMALAVLEAMASGCCVVASDIPANAGLITDGSTGLLFRSGDAADLARVLRRSLRDAGIRCALGAAAHRAALPYSWDTAAEITGQVLADVACEGAHR